MPFVTGIKTEEIYRSSRLVSDVTGMPVQANKAIVGANAFAHEAGIHQHGVIQERRTYEIMDPASIGLNANQLVLGKHSGRAAFDKRLNELGFSLSKEDLDKAFVRFKDLCDKKKIVADADLEAIVADEVYTVPEEYHLEHLGVMTSQGGMSAAAIRMTHGEEVVEETGTGVGTVDAVFRTIDKIVTTPHTLEDYIVQAITGGTDALAEVTVRIRDNGNVYTGRSAHLDIVQASGRAYLQAINKLVHYKRTRPHARKAQASEELAATHGP
jgi:2-isopropylmalate synthase